MFKLDVLKQSNLQDDYCHSMLISLLRGLAALEVAAAHLRAQVFPGFSTIAHPTIWFQGLAFFTGFAHQAVVIFFLLSGWLVGGSLLNKMGELDAIRHYAIDRMTRLWIVLIPTFVAIVLFGLAGGTLSPSRFDFSGSNAYSMASLLGNLVGLQKIVVPPFGGNFPLWSLSNETWYYVLFPLLVVLFRTTSMATRLVTLVSVIAIARVLSVDIMVYFLLWLLGAGFSRIRISTNAAVRLLLLFAFAIVSILFRLKGKNNDLDLAAFGQDLVFSVSFLLFLVSIQFKLPSRSRLVERSNQIGKFFANFSFTLYVLHIPLIGAILYFSRPYFDHNRLQQDNLGHLGLYVAMNAAIVLAAYLFYIPFEANTYRLRRQLKKAFLLPQPLGQA